MIQDREAESVLGKELDTLLMLTADGDHRAFATLFDVASAKLFGLALRICRDRELAIDALQDAFVHIWRNAWRFNPERGQGLGWMIVIQRNRAVALLRKHGRGVEARRSGDLLLTSPANPPKARGSSNELLALARCMGDLDDRGQELLLLAYYEGWTREEMAIRLRAPVHTIKSWLRRSLMTLRSSMERGVITARREDERSLSAAERALGLVSRREETPREEVLREEWEHRFAGLGAVIAPVQPPPGMLHGVEARIETVEATESLDAAEERAFRWRAATLGLGALVVVLGSFLGYAPAGLRSAPEHYFAVVYEDANPTRPGMIMQFDVAEGVTTVIPMPLEQQIGTSFEIWQRPADGERPFSLGLLPPRAVVRDSIVLRPGDTLAISKEPAGGSPTGQPTLPLFHGTVRAVE
ncbi:MAG: sigma-70 family RNA polymerase sigma factor [Pseudomonadota bacterium]